MERSEVSGEMLTKCSQLVWNGQKVTKKIDYKVPALFGEGILRRGFRGGESKTPISAYDITQSS